MAFEKRHPHVIIKVFDLFMIFLTIIKASY